jgi:hypothetical protein
MGRVGRKRRHGVPTPKVWRATISKVAKELEFLGIQRLIMIWICGSETLLDGREILVVCTENLIRVDDVMESPKLAE